ncbi:MAG TPA: hypothetical protein VK101_11280 [Limnochordia bacterium]|nr:hypothetical protein [Limnochordia bacterium]
MEERCPPVELVEIQDRVVPDNSFEDAYAIYFTLSYEPPLVWQERFEHLMQREAKPRVTSFVGPALRVVIGRRENLESVFRQIEHVVRKTNIDLDFTGAP